MGVLSRTFLQSQMGNGVDVVQVSPPSLLYAIQSLYLPPFPYYNVSGVLVVYTLRVNMSVAAQDMRDELNWSEGQKGLVLVSVFLIILLTTFINCDTWYMVTLLVCLLLGVCGRPNPSFALCTDLWW